MPARRHPSPHPDSPAGPPTPAAWGHRAFARPRGKLWSAVSVALATLGCAPPGPTAPAQAVEGLRQQRSLGAPLGISLSTLQAGPADAPLLLLVHGTPGSAASWADYLLDPPPGLQVMALDRPGFGQSGPCAAMPGLAEQAAAVAALLPTDGRPVVLLGHSLGGPVVARVAVDHPGRITGLVLLAASLDPAQEQIHPMQRLGDWPLLRGLLPRAIRNANTELLALKPELEALALQLPRIRARVVIVHGSADDLVPVANVAFMQAHLVGAGCLITTLLDGRNHFLPWNSAAEVRLAVAQAFGPALAATAPQATAAPC